MLIVDDLIKSGRTLAHYSQSLKKAGARNVLVCASHGVLSKESVAHIDDSCIKNVLVLNTLPLPKNVSQKVQQLSIGPQLADLITAEHFSSITFEDEYFELDSEKD